MLPEILDNSDRLSHRIIRDILRRDCRSERVRYKYERKGLTREGDE